ERMSSVVRTSASIPPLSLRIKCETKGGGGGGTSSTREETKPDTISSSSKSCEGGRSAFLSIKFWAQVYFALWLFRSENTEEKRKKRKFILAAEALDLPAHRYTWDKGTVCFAFVGALSRSKISFLHYRQRIRASCGNA